MKLKSLLTILLFVPFVVMAQNKVNVADGKKDVTQEDKVLNSATDTTKVAVAGADTYAEPDPSTVVFYNTGEIYFGKKATTKDTSGANLVKNDAKQNQVMLVSGSMENKLNSITKTVGVGGSVTKVVVDGGEMDMAKESAIAITGNIRNLYFKPESLGSVWMIGGTETIAGSDPQQISGDTYTKTSFTYNGDVNRFKDVKVKQRVYNFNQVPNLIVGEFAHVSLEVDQDKNATHADYNNTTALITPNGTVGVQGGGLFSVKTAYSKFAPTARKMYVPTLAMGKKMEIGAAPTAGGVGGQVLYDWKVYNSGASAGNAGSNLVAGSMASGLAVGQRKVLTPFVSPYIRLGADYFLFNALTSPDGQAIGGGAEGPIVNPTTWLEAGKPYFTAMDVSNHDYKEITSSHKVNENYRAYGGYLFNRDYYMATNTEKNKFNKLNGDTQRSKEIFGDVNTEYSFQLRDGLNFVVNPYLAMVNYKDLILADGAAAKTLTDWHGQGGGVAPTVSRENSGGTLLRSTVWFPENGSIQYYRENVSAKDFFRYNVFYRDAKATGGTWMEDNFLMPPLTVFALEVSAKGKDYISFKIPKSKIVTDLLTSDPNGSSGSNNPVTPRAGMAYGNTEDQGSAYERHDEILLEAETVNLEDDNAGNSVIDRLSVVLRDNASFASIATSNMDDDYIDNVKVMTVKSPENSSTRNFVYGKTGGDNETVTVSLAQRLPGALYSISSDNYAMVTTAIPTSVRELPVYYTPTYVRSKVTIRPYRLESLETVNQVWLVDHFDDDRVTEVTPDMEYTFISEPISDELAKANRFTLVFGDEPGGDDVDLDGEDKSINCYYVTGVLHIKNLIEEDLGSKVQIYDMQGRLMGNTVVRDYPMDEYAKPLAPGAYIVRILGNRSYTTKIMALP